MKRRVFLAAGATAIGAAYLPPISLAQNVKKAAVVIGVDKAGSLTPLNAAASGARSFADWLQGEGFDVTRFIDGKDENDDPIRIKIDPIFDAINGIVQNGTYHQLVVYFAGHGFLNSYRELWMLSDAPNNPNQAISLVECQRLSRRTGIPNVIFISDACRSTASSLAADSVRGSVIFPGGSPGGGSPTKVDTFLATQEGDPAYEVGVAESTGSYFGIYTESFLQAYRSPTADMVTDVDGVSVVLNRDLEEWLSRDVSRRAQMRDINLDQRPETIVTSENYIGRVAATPEAVGALPGPGPTFQTATALAFVERGFDVLATDIEVPQATVRDSRQTREFDRARQRIATAVEQAPKSFETETGLFVSGTDVDEVHVAAGMGHVELAPEKGPGVIRLAPVSHQPYSAAIRFAGGAGTVVAALPGYIGTIVVDDGRVVSVSYLRSGTRTTDSDEDSRLAELRELVATSARFGTFRIPGTGDEQRDRAEALGNKIRMLKSIDPTLGIYSAYAYSEADLVNKIQSVHSFMGSDIGGEIFDVALLAGVLRDRVPEERAGVAPFCPMLSQGWGLLRISNVQLDPRIDAARDHIEPALWTTFRPAGMDIVLDAMQSGGVI